MNECVIKENNIESNLETHQSWWSLDFVLCFHVWSQSCFLVFQIKMQVIFHKHPHHFMCTSFFCSLFFITNVFLLHCINFGISKQILIKFSFVYLEFFVFFPPYFGIYIFLKFGSQHLCLKHNNGVYAIFCLGVAFPSKFFFGALFLA